MSRGPLCDIDDVKGYVPAYSGTEADDKLEALIDAQSELIQVETGRQIIAVEETQPATARFPVSRIASRTRVVRIDDLGSIEDLEIKVIGLANEEIETVASSAWRPVYESGYAQGAPWEPIVAIEFPLYWSGAPVLLSGYELEITGTWGFPEVPSFVREACAGRVILRYLSDVANAGDAFSEAIENVNLSALFRSAEDALEALTGQAVMA